MVFAAIMAVCACGENQYDIIYTTDGKSIEAVIAEVSKAEVKYHEPGFMDGPLFVVSTEDIILINFSNGQVKTYNVGTSEHTQESAQQQAAQQKKLEQQQELLDMTERMGERLGESIVNMADAIQAAKHPYYFLKVCNLRSHTRKVYVDGTYMGEVPSGKTVQFQVPLSLWGNCVLVQKNGYLLQASKESYTMRSQPNSRQVVTITDK